MGSGYQEIMPHFPTWDGQPELFAFRQWFANYIQSQVGLKLGDNIGPGYPQTGTPWTTAFKTTEPTVYHQAMYELNAMMADTLPTVLQPIETSLRNIIPTGDPSYLGAQPPIVPYVHTALVSILPTGLPVNLTVRYATTLTETQLKLTEELNARMDEKNVNGGRYSSGAAYAVAFATQRAITEWGSVRSAEVVAAEESALVRRLSSSQIGVALGQLLSERQYAELTDHDHALQHGMDLAQLLINLPLAIYSTSAQTSYPQWTLEATAVQNEFQAWMAKQPQNNPALKMAYGWGTSFPQGASAPTIAESPWLGMISGVVGAAGSIASAGILAA